MEDQYHDANQFRWFLNVFLKALNETPDLLHRELQNNIGWKEWYRPQSKALKGDPLISALSLKRNFVVHQNMLVPKSSAQIGITELRGMKLGISMKINPLEDSDNAMKRYLKMTEAHGDVLGILMPDDDSIPCVKRTWQLEHFDDEIVALCSKAWLRTGQNLTATLNFLGENSPEYSLDCGRHQSQNQRFQYKLYNRDDLIAQANPAPIKFAINDKN